MLPAISAVGTWRWSDRESGPAPRADAQCGHMSRNALTSALAVQKANTRGYTTRKLHKRTTPDFIAEF